MNRYLPLALFGVVAVASAQGSLVVPSGTGQLFDTNQTPVLVVDQLVIEADAYLRVIGSQPLIVIARNQVRIDGQLIASGLDGPDVVGVGTLPWPGPGGIGVVSGGGGGAGSPLDPGLSAQGLSGLGIFGLALPSGGAGGESSYLETLSTSSRQGAGGGGGRFALDEPVGGSVEDPQNRGLVALDGADGSAQAFGALSGLSPAAGGKAGAPVFADGDPANDFFGVGFGPGGQLVTGELPTPLAGSGGGGGGDSIRSSVFPAVLPLFGNDEQSGGGGGAGGGLVLLVTRRFEMGPAGLLVANGGRGGRGQSSLGLNGIGGGGGGGSGGMILVQASAMDLGAATGECFSARGGYGGPGTLLDFFADNHGGMGGPGLIQLHVLDEALIQLPPGLGLDDLSAPNARVVQPLPVPPQLL